MRRPPGRSCASGAGDCHRACTGPGRRRAGAKVPARMQPKDVADEILARRWFYEFELPDGRRTEPYVPADAATIHPARRDMLGRALRETFGDDWSSLTALDLACHQGWFASELARGGFADVLGVDVRQEHLDDAGLIRDVYGLDQLRLERHDVARLEPGSLGQFDVVLVLGLIYHLENPVGALRVARGHTRRLCLVETQLGPNVSGPTDWGSYRYVKPIVGSFAVVDETPELDMGNREANTVVVSLFPSLEALLFIMRSVGFDRVEVVPADGTNEQLSSGKRAMVAGWVES
jgi:tRNA (mo5U34)-methyltransferase